MVNEVQPYQLFPPLIVKLVRLDGRVNEVNEVQLYQVFAPLIVKLVRLDGNVNEVNEERQRAVVDEEKKMCWNTWGKV